MSTTHTLDPSIDPTTVTGVAVPADGDGEDAASVDTPFGVALDLAAHANWPETNNTKSYRLKSRSLLRVSSGMPSMSDPARFTFGAVGSPATADTTTAHLYYPIEAPHGSTINDVTLFLRGGAGHSALPGTPVAITLFKLQLSNGAGTSLGTTNDGSSTFSAYESDHSISISGLTEVADRQNFRYLLQVDTEQGANTHSGCIFSGASVQFTTTTQDAGAA